VEKIIWPIGWSDTEILLPLKLHEVPDLVSAGGREDLYVRHELLELGNSDSTRNEALNCRGDCAEV
jgi:hypothetical protein